MARSRTKPFPRLRLLGRRSLLAAAGLLAVLVAGTFFLTPDCRDEGCPTLANVEEYAPPEPPHVYDHQGRLVAGTELAGFLAADALQLRAQVPMRSALELVGLSLPDCRVAVTRVDSVAEGFLLTAWSEALPASCNVPLNATVSASPLYRQAAYSVPRTAVFTREGEAQVLVRRGDSLEAVHVSLLTPVDGNYAVTTATDLADSAVLVTSVSAVQGILLGLGGE